MKSLPTISEILDVPLVKGLITKLNRGEVVSTALLVLGELALQAKESARDFSLPTITDVANRIADKLLQNEPARLVSTINATGLLFPSELGTPPLPATAITSMTELAKGYVAMGRPVNRWDNTQLLRSVENLVGRLVGAEAVMPVNTADAGWYLTLHALKNSSSIDRNAPVIISRGHLFELPSGCRISDIFMESGTDCVEVGSVNKTSIDDYANVSVPLKAIVYIYSGTGQEYGRQEPTVAELSKLAKAKKIPLIVDIGQCGLTGDKNTVNAASCLADGADLVIMRGGTLFGGPPCGMILGKKTLIDICRNSILSNVFLCSPYTLAALEQTLLLYSQPDGGMNSIPVEQILHFSEASLVNRAQRIQKQIVLSNNIASADTEIVEQSLVMTQWLSIKLPTCRIIVKPKTGTAQELGKRLSRGTPAVLGIVKQDAVVLDIRTVLPHQDIALVEALL